MGFFDMALYHASVTVYFWRDTLIEFAPPANTNNTQIWPYLCGILFKFFPNVSSNFRLFPPFITNS